MKVNWQMGMFLLFAVACMAGQPAALREYFSGKAGNSYRAADPIFYDEARYRPHLLGLLHDKNFGPHARWLLSLIGYPEDVRKMVSIGVSPDEAYDVVAALLAPSTEAEWEFLRRAAVLEYGTGGSRHGAVQTLRLLATPRSQRILKEALEDHPPASTLLEDASLVRLASMVANAVDAGSLQEIGEPRFNRGGDKALIEFTYQAGRCRFSYTATFHRLGGDWRLRGLREVMQYLLGPAPLNPVQKQP